MDDLTTIIGLGYVGLPLALEAARAGHRVLGLDISEEVVSGLTRGQSHVDDLSDEDVQEMLALGFAASSNFAGLVKAKTVVICVPTPLSSEGSPDLVAVQAAVRNLRLTCIRQCWSCWSRPPTPAQRTKSFDQSWKKVE